jgi:hypothetical protein
VGSISRYNALERFGEAFGDRIKEHYEKRLLGLTIQAMGELIIDYYKSTDVSLSDGSVITVHFGWTSEEEDHEQREIVDEGELTTQEYFNTYLKGKTITRITTGYERDDEYYVFAFVDEDHCLEIPIGFDPECCEYHGDEDLISEEEFEAFRNR